MVDRKRALVSAAGRQGGARVGKIELDVAPVDACQHGVEFGLEVREGLGAGVVVGAALEYAVQGQLGIVGAGRDHLIGRGNAVKDQGAHAGRVAARIVLGQPRAVRRAKHIDLAVAKRDAHAFDVMRGIGSCVQGWRVLERFDAAGEGVQLFGLGGDVVNPAVAIGATQLARPAGAALVDQYDVAGGAQALEHGAERGGDIRTGLSRPARQDEYRINAGCLPKRGRHRHMQLQLCAAGLLRVQRHGDGVAAQGALAAAQVAILAGLGHRRHGKHRAGHK